MYIWIEHTAELELAIAAHSRAAVFEDALSALAELIAPDGPTGRPVRHTLTVRASDGEALLADWLSELVFLADTEEFVPERVEELALSDRSLRAVVSGRTGRPSQLVKAVTYHGLELHEEADGFRARIVLDV